MPKPKPADGHTSPAHPKPRKNHCFACGKDNPQGMKLNFYLEEESRRAICEFKLSRNYQGPPGHAHGGIIATILDEAMGKAARFHSAHAVTADLRIEYKKPIRVNTEIVVEGFVARCDGRQLYHEGEIRNEAGDLLARGEGRFVIIDLEKYLSR